MRALIKQLLERCPAEYMFTLVDVGSMAGMQPEWLPFAEQIRMVGFEPDEREFARLASSPRCVYLNLALAGTSRPLMFHLTRGTGRSSVYQPNLALLREFPEAERFEPVGEVQIPAGRVQSLSAALSQQRISEVDFLKLDTQGSELDILRGAGDGLSRSVLGVRVEVEFRELYLGQPLFAEVDAFLRGAGFQIVQLQRHFWKHRTTPGRGELIFGDALYFKDPAAWGAMLASRAPAEAQAKALKFVALALVYGLNDFALRLAERHLPADVAAKIRAAQPRAWTFRGSGLIRAGLLRLARGFSNRATPWADSDPPLSEL